MKSRRQLNFARGVALILLCVGLGLIVGDLRHPAPVRTLVAFDGAVTVQGRQLRLRERRERSATYVDILVGEHIVAAADAVDVGATVAATDYSARYGSRYALYVSVADDQPAHLLEILAPDRLRRIELAGRGAPTVSEHTLTSSAAWAQQRATTTGHLPRTVPTVPGPSLVLLAMAVWLGFGLRVAPAARPTQLLVLLQAVVGTMVAWPMMLHTGLARTLPPALIALLVTLLIASALGPRLQTVVWARQRALRGVVAGGLVLGVFAVLLVNINGFIAPVFRPPGAGLSPAQWVMQDLIAPVVALISMGVAPASILGFLYGVRGEHAHLQ